MSENLIKTIKLGFNNVKSKPQLWWTALLALLIVLGFAVSANMFVSVAQDAQDRLINVRIGSIQDVLAQFVPLHIDDQNLLQEKVNAIASSNETITTFKILKLDNDNAVIVASLNKEDIGKVESKFTESLSFALRDHKNSYTFERFSEERLFDTVRAVVDDSGKIIGSIVTTQTLSEADKLIDVSIKMSIAILIGIVLLIMVLFLRHSKIIDYISLYKKLKDVDQLKDDFIGMASHELRTPLSIIGGYASLLDESPNINKDDKDNLKKIGISIKHLNGLISDMLDVSRIEQGIIEFDFEVLNPTSLIEEMIEGFKIQAELKNLKLNTNISEGGDIKIDQSKIKQILNNIIGNAVKYTKQGNVEVNTRTDGKDLIIRVSDTGLGMNSEEQENLFKKFYRIKNDDTAGIAGTGLGLWITKQLVESMDGTVEVQSIKGVATHFILRFPLVK